MYRLRTHFGHFESSIRLFDVFIVYKKRRVGRNMWWARACRFVYNRIPRTRRTTSEEPQCIPSTSSVRDLSTIQVIILALSKNIEYAPANLSEERIVSSLKQIAKGLPPNYHLKMRQRDVEELETYRLMLLERKRVRAAERSSYLLASASLY